RRAARGAGRPLRRGQRPGRRPLRPRHPPDRSGGSPLTAPKSVLCAIGTRPEAIKMAPVILALRADPAFRCRVLATAQHRQMLDQVLSVFGIVPDVDLDIMQPDQSLCDLTGRL